MFFFGNNSGVSRVPTALEGVGDRLWYLKLVLLLTIVISGILPGFGAFAEPFSGVVLTPISQSNLSALNVSPTFGSTISLHHFDLSCSRCHDQKQSTNTSAPQTPLEEIGLVDVNRACSSFGCHSYDRDLNHPVGVSAGMASTSYMPLDENGRITCLTCHSQGESEFSEPVENAINERMLQTTKDGELCGTCHTSAIGGMGNEVHWQFSKKAHLSKIKRNTDNSFDDFSFGNAIDDESQTCVGCHDDVTVTVPELFESRSQKQMRYRKMKDHPIGMEFSAIVTRDAGRYINSHSLSDKVRLFDGRVGCGSCHSLYSDKKSHLIVEHTVSELCRECHIR